MATLPSDSDDSNPSRHVRFSMAERRPLLRKSRTYERCASAAGDDLRSFRSWLRWMCLDHTGPRPAALSWAVFLGAAVVVPAASHFVLSYDRRRRRFDALVQASLTAVATLSFTCLSALVRRHGLRRLLFLDSLCGESEKVRSGYTDELNRSFKLLSISVLPCLAAETAYKLWWYRNGAGRIPFLGNQLVSDAVACAFELFSWLYRTSIFFLLCVLFRLMCHLQILRLHDFATLFHEQSSDVAPILTEHLRVRRYLRVISHRFRMFIVSCLVLVTLSQLAALLLTTSSHADVNIFNTGELALCSVTIVSGLFLCLRSAAKITHKAQAITSLAAKWHVCATIDSSIPDAEAPVPGSSHPQLNPDELTDEEVDYHDDDSLEDIIFLQPFASTISFQKRQALVLTCFAVTYLENNKAGITVFGFMLDRSWLHMIFGVELSLVLWLLGKTIGIS